LIFASRVKADTYNGTLNAGTLSTGLSGTVIGPPTATPSAGTFNSVQSVVLTKPSGAQNVRYTKDGSTPDCSSSTIYSSAIAVNSTKTIKAISCYADGSSSSVASFVYTINLIIVPSNLPDLLSNGTFSLPSDGSTSGSTSAINVTQQVTINVNSSSIVIPQNTVITPADPASHPTFSATDLTAASISGTSLAGLGTGNVVEGALQWGIANLSLQFNSPISLSIFVGTNLNGQTLNVERSSDQGITWTSDGIVAPATCVVTADGYCNFQANKASYYVTYQTQTTATTIITTPITTTTTSSGGGGGGGGSVTPTLAIGNIKGSGLVDKYDFAILMSQWSQTGSNLSADLNHDLAVNKYDFAILMTNWGK
jgi:hypothetical protein